MTTYDKEFFRRKGAEGGKKKRTAPLSCERARLMALLRHGRITIAQYHEAMIAVKERARL